MVRCKNVLFFGNDENLGKGRCLKGRVLFMVLEILVWKYKDVILFIVFAA